MKIAQAKPLRITGECVVWFVVMGALWFSADLDPVIFMQGFDLWIIPVALAWTMFRLAPPPRTPWPRYVALWVGLILFIAICRWWLSLHFFAHQPNDAERIKRWFVPLLSLPFPLIRLAWRQWLRRRDAYLSLSVAHSHLSVIAVFFIILIITAVTWNAVTIDLSPWLQGSTLNRWLNMWIIGVVPIAMVGLLSASIVMALASGPYLWLSHYATRPIIKRLAQLEKVVSDPKTLETSQPISISGRDEIGRLQQEFNTMAQRLQQTMQDQGKEQSQLKALMIQQAELMAAIGHELRTPLAMIRSTLDSLEADQNSSRELVLIGQQFDGLTSLVDDLFLIARERANQLPTQIQDIHVGNYLEEMAELWRSHLWQRFRLQLVFESKHYHGKAPVDPQRLRQIVTNLLHNAARYTPPGGLIRICLTREDHIWYLEVSDTGQGIPPQQLEHIWKPFQSNDQDKAAQTGLGLAVVHTLVKGMGGTITVDSHPGQGACFRLEMRLSQPD